MREAVACQVAGYGVAWVGGWVGGGRSDLGGPVGRRKPSAAQGLVLQVNLPAQSIFYGCDWPCAGGHTFFRERKVGAAALSSQITLRIYTNGHCMWSPCTWIHVLSCARW